MEASLTEAHKEAARERRLRTESEKHSKALETQLAEVETFIRSPNGDKLAQLERELAEARLRLADAETERDELEVVLVSATGCACCCCPNRYFLIFKKKMYDRAMLHLEITRLLRLFKQLEIEELRHQGDAEDSDHSEFHGRDSKSSHSLREFKSCS